MYRSEPKPCYPSVGLRVCNVQVDPNRLVSIEVLVVLKGQMLGDLQAMFCISDDWPRRGARNMLP